MEMAEGDDEWWWEEEDTPVTFGQLGGGGEWRRFKQFQVCSESGPYTRMNAYQ